jgi:hypothetical protein
MTIKLDISQVQAKSYLEHQPEALRELTEACAKAFVRGRDREPKQRRTPEFWSMKAGPMASLTIIERLKLLSRGDNLDLVDIVCADAIAHIERLESEVRKSGSNHATEVVKDGQIGGAE